MAVVAMLSAKGSPGVTCTALACTMTWRRPVVLAECDPSGGSVMDGYLRGQVRGDHGMLPLAMAELRDGTLQERFWSQLIDLDAPKRQRLLLPGITDPVQAGSLAPVWDQFAACFTQLDQPGYDVIADCGRLTVPHPPWPIICTADAVLLVIRPTLPGIAAAVPIAAAVTRQVTDQVASSSSVALAVVGDGPYTAAEAARQLRLPLAARIPSDRRTASGLSCGGTVRTSRPLTRAAAGCEAEVRAVIDRRRRAVPPGVTQPAPAAGSAPGEGASHGV